MYASANTPKEAAASSFIDITELYRMKFLNENSTVWLNADAPEAGIWVLTDRSTYVKVYRNAYAGWLRLTRSNARWARTLNATSRDATPVMDIRSIPGDSNPVATLVVVHRDYGNRVRVVADGKIQNPDSRGVITFDPFSVVDLSHYIPPDVSKKVSAYEAAHAMINGAAIMSCTATDEGEFVRSNMDLFHIDWHQGHLDFLGSHWDNLENYANMQTEILIQKIIDNGKAGMWADTATYE
jgi:hypothetical protein